MISGKLRKHELLKGKIYVFPFTGTQDPSCVIFLHDNPPGQTNHFINSVGVYKYAHCLDPSDIYMYREATPEEEDWLKNCIEAGTSVPKSQTRSLYDIY